MLLSLSGGKVGRHGMNVFLIFCFGFWALLSSAFVLHCTPALEISFTKISLSICFYVSRSDCDVDLVWLPPGNLVGTAHFGHGGQTDHIYGTDW